MIFRKMSYLALSAYVICTAAFVSILVGTTGCAPGRSQYYDRLGQRRERSYERWREGVEDEHAPHIEGELSIDDALQLSFNHSPRLLAALQGQEEGRGRVVEAYSAALPNVDISGGYTRLDRVSTIEVGAQSFEVGDRDNYNVGLDVTQPLYQGGAIPIAQRVARLFDHLNEEVIRAAVEENVFQVANAYYRALLTEELVEVEEAALESAERHLEVAKSRREQGLARDYDVLRARVEVSNIEASLIEQRQEKEKAYSALWRTMGVSQKSEVVLTDELDYTDIEAPDFEDAVAQAFHNSPDIYQATIEADMSEEAVAETRTRYMPRLNAFYNFNWARPDPHDSLRDDWGDEWQAGLRLNWAIFDGLGREGQMIQRRADLRRTEILLDDTEQQAIKEVRDALLDIESAHEMVRSQELNIQQAAEAERLVEEGYREGVNTEIELLDARTAVAEARGLYYRALYRLKTANLSLQKATGELAPEP